MQVVIHHYPQLERLCWNLPGADTLDGAEALAIYERNWRFVDEEAIGLEERSLIDQLVARHGGGAFCV